MAKTHSPRFLMQIRPRQARDLLRHRFVRSDVTAARHFVCRRNFVLNTIQLALETNYAKVAEPALECTFKLFSFGLFRGEVHNNVSNPILYKIVEGVCTVGGIGEEPLELAVLRVLLAAIRCPCILVRGYCLINVVRTCYNIYIRGLSGTNQICAKSVLVQIVLIIFTRAEEDSIDVPIKKVFVSELLEFSDKTLNEGISIYHCQNFVSEVMNASEGVPDLKLSQPSKDQELQNVELKENDDQILLRGKTLSLELLKVVMDNRGSIWRSNVRQVFAVAAVDDRKNIVLIAFETMEKIVREYFHHVTETGAATFTDCVRCLVKFTNSRFDSDVSLNAISFLRLCSVKLAEGGLVCADKSSDDGSYISVATKNDSDLQSLSELTLDSRLAIRKSSLEELFNVPKDHGHLFSRTFWIGVFNSVVLPIFNGASPVKQCSPTSKSPHSDRSPWDLETSAISFYDVLRSQLPNLVSVLAGYLKSSIQGPASTGVTVMYRLTVELGSRLTKDQWQKNLLAIKDAASATLPGFMKILRTMDDIKLPENSGSSTTTETSSEQGLSKDDI
ncbi:Brefeldin A-inhibited guanine nucleotide-exchange protein 1 [Hibiscus syriacus]|uniref:Brefeldin A-inhibited guanine nucleotide-exchange protein 1 n=1 Tax=Hibiscus syriacus TaxID=106335 RepID=A0A6A2YFX1_HIBSY|nr:Brefeldin A-inhibited guanine nucleotide-exchange protein 1 [Hibiscus syriacus]